MGHRIVDAIIEDGQLKYVGEKLPAGLLEVHLIYDTTQERIAKQQSKGDREEDRRHLPWHRCRCRDKAASA